MTNPLIYVVRLAAFIAGACVSYKYVGGYWVVGPVFGAVVLLWYADSPKKLLSIRAAAYLLASTLVWALVFWLSGQEKISHQDILVPVAAGSVLLPLAHTLLLGSPVRRTLIAIPAVYGAFLLLNWLSDQVHLTDHGVFIKYACNVVTAWQAAYLACFFFKKGR